jgi:hypothetical protein
MRGTSQPFLKRRGERLDAVAQLMLGNAEEAASLRRLAFRRAIEQCAGVHDGVRSESVFRGNRTVRFTNQRHGRVLGGQAQLQLCAAALVG